MYTNLIVIPKKKEINFVKNYFFSITIAMINIVLYALKLLHVMYLGSYFYTL